MNESDLRHEPHVAAFNAAAETYCNLLASPPADAERWVEEILAALAQLYACAHALPDVELDESGA